MDDSNKKSDILDEIDQKLGVFSPEEMTQKHKKIEDRLFELANFVEAKTALLYIRRGSELDTISILKRCFDRKKIVVIPLFNPERRTLKLLKIENIDSDLVKGPEGVLVPNASKCKSVPIDHIDIAVIPGSAFDEKGGRIGSGQGYTKLMPKLPLTTRKISIAYEEQVTGPIPVESRNRNVDIIITDQRVIYKI